MLKIALIGSTGMLGIDVSSVLKGGNFQVKNFNSKNLDISKLGEVENAFSNFKPDYIINCAAYTFVDAAETDKEKADSVNHVGAGNLAEVALNIDSRIIHISTDYVFDGTKNSPYVEDDETNPINEYGLSKLRGESAIKESGASYLILRTSWLYGKNGNNFVNTILKMADNRKDIEVVNDQFGSPTYTKDVAYAISEIIMKDNSKNEVYHLTNGGQASWFEFASEIMKVFKRNATQIIPVTSERFPRPADRPVYSVLDNSKIREDYNISLRNWKDALRKYCNDIGYFLR